MSTEELTPLLQPTMSLDLILILENAIKFLKQQTQIKENFFEILRKMLYQIKETLKNQPITYLKQHLPKILEFKIKVEKAYNDYIKPINIDTDSQSLQLISRNFLQVRYIEFLILSAEILESMKIFDAVSKETHTKIIETCDTEIKKLEALRSSNIKLFNDPNQALWQLSLIYLKLYRALVLFKNSKHIDQGLISSITAEINQFKKTKACLTSTAAKNALKGIIVLLKWLQKEDYINRHLLFYPETKCILI